MRVLHLGKKQDPIRIGHFGSILRKHFGWNRFWGMQSLRRDRTPGSTPLRAPLRRGYGARLKGHSILDTCYFSWKIEAMSSMYCEAGMRLGGARKVANLLNNMAQSVLERRRRGSGEAARLRSEYGFHSRLAWRGEVLGRLTAAATFNPSIA